MDNVPYNALWIFRHSDKWYEATTHIKSEKWQTKSIWKMHQLISHMSKGYKYTNYNSKKTYNSLRKSSKICFIKFYQFYSFFQFAENFLRTYIASNTYIKFQDSLYAINKMPTIVSSVTSNQPSRPNNVFEYLTVTTFFFFFRQKTVLNLGWQFFYDLKLLYRPHDVK